MYWTKLLFLLPIVPKGPNDNTAIVFGISSWVERPACTSTSNIGVYQRVTQILDWIKSYMKDKEIGSKTSGKWQWNILSNPKTLPIDFYLNIKKVNKKEAFYAIQENFTAKVLLLFWCVKIRHILSLPNMANLPVPWMGYLPRLIQSAKVLLSGSEYFIHNPLSVLCKRI